MRKKYLLVLAGVVLLIGLGEVACRLIEQVYAYMAFHPLGPVVNLEALNYNDTTVTRAKPAGEFRVLAFGDSYVYSTVKTAFTPASVAADLLGQAGAKARVVNLGEPGVSFFQYRKALDHWTGRIEADAVVVGIFLGNDCAEIARHLVPDDLPVNSVLRDNFVAIATGRKRLAGARHAYGLRLLDYAADAINIQTTGDVVTVDVPEPHTGLYGPLEPDRYLEMTRLFTVAGQAAQCGEMTRGWQALAGLGRDLARLGREGKMRVAVMLSPAEVMVNAGLWREMARAAGLDPKSFDPTLPGRMARAVLAKVAPQVAVLDLTPAFACAAARGDVLYPPREIHWNAAGNRLAGQALARFVGQTWLGLPDGELAGLDPCLEAGPVAAGPADVESCLAAALPPGP
ncbi:hypothetical protein [Solidesulfovibrio sp.]